MAKKDATDLRSAQHQTESPIKGSIRAAPGNAGVTLAAFRCPGISMADLLSKHRQIQTDVKYSRKRGLIARSYLLKEL